MLVHVFCLFVLFSSFGYDGASECVGACWEDGKWKSELKSVEFVEQQTLQ